MHLIRSGNRIVISLSHNHSDESAARYCVASQEHCKQPELLVANDAEVNEHATRRCLDTAPNSLAQQPFAFCHSHCIGSYDEQHMARVPKGITAS